ncbi:RNA polymerase sigma factor [Streptomyces chartreusis]|uniref:RNA polymerase sigma factor n=1 Tax=Streptomyces chartreusis TaxID=1969 RepID=UPI00368E8D6C
MPEASQSTALTMEETFARHYGEMVGYARKALRAAAVPQSHADAEDVVQNAFSKAYRAPERVTQPRAYVYKIIKNEVQEHSARSRRTRLQVFPDPPGPASDCAESVAGICDVHQALRALPQTGRAALWATKVLGYSQAEYAQATGIPSGTVASLVARAVPVLKSALTVATAVAAVLACAGGALTARGYHQATPADRPLPTPLGEDAPQTVPAVLGAFGVIYACLALITVAAMIALTAPRLLSRSRHRLRPRRVVRLFNGTEPLRNTVYCRTCKKVTKMRQLTDEEKTWLSKQAGLQDAPRMLCSACFEGTPRIEKPG